MKKCVIYDDDFKQFKKNWNYIYEENIVERPSYDRIQNAFNRNEILNKID